MATNATEWWSDPPEQVRNLYGVRMPVFRAGDMAAFPKGEPNGHHLLNEGLEDCVFLAFGRPPQGDCHYSDIDMCLSQGRYRRRDGSLY